MFLPVMVLITDVLHYYLVTEMLLHFLGVFVYALLAPIVFANAVSALEVSMSIIWLQQGAFWVDRKSIWVFADQASHVAR